jgi:hypothetical protein
VVLATMLRAGRNVRNVPLISVRWCRAFTAVAVTW